MAVLDCGGDGAVLRAGRRGDAVDVEVEFGRCANTVSCDVPLSVRGEFLRDAIRRRALDQRQAGLAPGTQGGSCGRFFLKRAP